jgi:hypothetical protein
VTNFLLRRLAFLIFAVSISSLVFAEEQTSPDVSLIYQQLKDASVFEKSAFLESVPLERDPVMVTFTSGTVILLLP